MELKVKPFKKNILIKIIREENESSIIIPDTVRKERPQQGEVLAVGNEVKAVKAGDIVAYNYAKAHYFEGEGELDANIAKRVLIKEDDIYLKIQ
jgi:co-chaperonin GroES (HSP10)